MIGKIHQASGQGIRRICATLDVPRSSYYHAAAPTPMQSSDEEIGLEIEAVFKRHRRRYGYRRIRDQLADQGITCAPTRVRRIMLERGLKAIQPLPEKPNRVWAGDITFIPTAAGWIYLAVIIDLCSRKIVGWALADHMRAELVGDALKQALGSRDTAPDLIFHSDRGSQYGSGAYRQILGQAGMRQSMSARANPYHNAWTESFMGTLKSEMLQDGCFIDSSDARAEIFDYINAYYNTQRKHSALGYQTPAQFEANINSLN